MTRSVEEYVARLPSAQAEVVGALCGLIRDAAPEALESIKWAQPVWEVNGPVCSVKCFKNYTNVNFWRGAEVARLADPDRLLLGQGGQMRHIRVASLGDIRADPLRSLVRTAVELNQRFGNPTRARAEPAS